MKWLFLVFVLVVSACRHTESSKSQVTAVYRGHERRDTTPEENRWFINFGGASGVLLSARYVLTAEHVCKLLSRGSLPQERTPSFSVVRIIERSSNETGYDYCIAEIAWLTPRLPESVRFPVRIWTDVSEVTVGADNLATKVVTYGFPNEGIRNGAATHSAGYAKNLIKNEGVATFLEFNADAYGGNSGGPVYREHDRLLVSIVSGMRRAPRYEFDVDPSNPDSWNWGPALYELVPKSPIFQSIFASGTNSFADQDGKPYTDEVGSKSRNGQLDVLWTKNIAATWKDPRSRLWRTRAMVQENFLPDSACPTDFRYPTEDELRDALVNGMRDPRMNPDFATFFINHADLSFWLRDFNATGSYLHLHDGNMSIHQDTSPNGVHFSLCVKA